MLLPQSQMVSSSITTAALYSLLYTNDPKIFTHSSIVLPSRLAIAPLYARKSLSFLPRPQLRSFPNRFHVQSGKFTSNLSIERCCSHSTQKAISKFLTEKVVTFLFGSFIFMGCIGAKPVIAQPAQKTSYRETVGDKWDTRNEKSEDEELHEKLVEENPRNVDALKVIVNVKMKKGKTKEALEYVERLIDIEPNEVEWKLLQALCYEIMGQLSKAKRLFKDILKQRPLLLRALHGLAMVMHKNHEGMAVFEMLNGALEVARREKRVTEERNIRILIGQMHVVKGQLDEALKKFQDLIGENPRDFRPYLCQGIIYSLLDKEKEAHEQFEIYRNLVPEEFPQRGFLDDVVLAAKTESRQQLEEEFKTEFSYKN